MFTEWEVQDRSGTMMNEAQPTTVAGFAALVHVYRVVIVDDERETRELCRRVLEPEGIQIHEAANGLQALEVTASIRCDLLLLDIDMPGMQGTEVLKALRAYPPAPHLKIIMMSGRAPGDEMARMMRAGADDYLGKPFSTAQLAERVKAALRLKSAQERTDQLNRDLLTVNHELEMGLLARDSDLVQARNALVLALAELVSHRDAETGEHLMRLQHYSRILAEEARKAPGFAGQIDDNFIKMLECCAPLHDIGKVGVPDEILQKPGRLTEAERQIMQRHTVIAAVTLQKVARIHGFAVAFLQMATEVARHHHERFDGKGYPDRLVGDGIPLSARIVAIADVYDALRSPRIYKAGLKHADAMHIMQNDVGHFDPKLMVAFQTCAHEFDSVYQQLK